jgi:hypothetical protein
LHTERPDGLLESPMKCRLEKPYKATIQACIETDIQHETNKAHKEKEMVRRYYPRSECSLMRVDSSLGQESGKVSLSETLLYITPIPSLLVASVFSDSSQYLEF